MSKARGSDAPDDATDVETLKGDLNCWEPDPDTQEYRLHTYAAGDPVPGHLTQKQRENLAAQGVI